VTFDQFKDKKFAYLDLLNYIHLLISNRKLKLKRIKKQQHCSSARNIKGGKQLNKSFKKDSNFVNKSYLLGMQQDYLFG
jgi:hypothetical protein